MSGPGRANLSPKGRARVVCVGALVLAVLAVAVVVSQTLGTETARSAAIAPCSAVETATPSRRVTCRTAQTRLTIAPEGEPVLVPGTEVRVLGSELRGRVLHVRLRLRNTTGTSQRLPVGRGQLYASVGGRRFELAPLVGDGRRPGSSALHVRFRLDADAASAVRRGRARTDLGIVPWEHLAEERAPWLGVVRLDPA